MTSQTTFQPGVYFDVDEGLYHSDPCERPSLSSSIGKVILAQSPLHARHLHPRLNPLLERIDEKKYDTGKVVHSILLESEAEKISVLPFADYRKKAAKAARDQALASGLMPIKEDEYERCLAIVQSARREIALFKEGAAFADGVSEVTLIWEEPGGVICRARIDRMSRDRRHLFDLKTEGQSAHPDAFGRKIINMGYDFSAAFYLRGFRKCFPDLPAPEWSWLAVETDPPHGVSITGMDETGLAIANQQVDIAIAIWRECMATNKWPGYPHKKRIIETKLWAITGAETLSLRLGNKPTTDAQAIRDMMFAWQAPIAGSGS